jgi:hypothetical protein
LRRNDWSRCRNHWSRSSGIPISAAAAFFRACATTLALTERLFPPPESGEDAGDVE